MQDHPSNLKKNKSVGILIFVDLLPENYSCKWTAVVAPGLVCSPMVENSYATMNVTNKYTECFDFDFLERKFLNFRY